jgi:DNA-binding LacI/PurR family transcriptional regulator
MSITIHDLAKIAGVNSSTVSRALRNDPCVRQATRERIQALAVRYGYTPNLNARNLADGKTHMIAFMMGSLDYQLECDAAVVLNEIFSRHGYTLMIFSYAPDVERFYLDRLEKFSQKICDGAILLAPGYRLQSPRLLSVLQSVRIPLVCLDRWFDGIRLPVVTTDNSVAVRELFEAAYKAGMDAAICNFHCNDSTSAGRRREFERCFAEKQFPFLMPERPEEIPLFLQKKHSVRPAVLSTSSRDFTEWLPFLPAGFITAAFDRGVPPQRELYGPIILCVQNYREIARQGAQIMLNLLKQEPSVPDDPVLIEPETILYV